MNIDLHDRNNEHVIADFFSALHTELNVEDRRDELMTNFFACCSRLCLRSNFLELNICLQCQHVVDFFVDFDLISNVEDERFERFNKVIVLNINANSFIDFWIANEADDLCEANDVFLISHTKLIALIER